MHHLPKSLLLPVSSSLGIIAPDSRKSKQKKAPPPDFMTTFDDVGPCGVLGGFSLGVVFLFCEQNTAGG